jgi:hypothetical protein
MKNSIIWLLFKALFSRTKFKQILKKLDKEKVIEYMDKAVKEQNYELAAYLKYYLESEKFN